MKKILIYLPILFLALAFVNANEMTIVSGPDAEYQDGGSWYNAVPLTYIYPEWTVRIPGASLPGAAWMWSSDGVTPDEAEYGSEVLFKHEFDLGCAENFVGTIDITTDNEFTLRINNDFIATDAEWSSLATYDISEYLKSGDNTIVIEAVNEPMFGVRDPQINPAGVIYKADITYDEKDCGTDNPLPLPAEIPEFGVIASAGALIGALGIFLYKKKS